MRHRRLAGVGVSFVTVYNGGWDHHTNIFKQPFRKKVDLVDTGMAALINDRHDRGQLDSTLVLLLGEFGRTPKINKNNSRDHWPRGNFAFLAGGGMNHVQIIGSTDKHGNEPVDRPVKFQEVFATLYHNIGIDLNNATVLDAAGRPHYLVDQGIQPIRELVG